MPRGSWVSCLLAPTIVEWLPLAFCPVSAEALFAMGSAPKQPCHDGPCSWDQSPAESANDRMEGIDKEGIHFTTCACPLIRGSGLRVTCGSRHPV